MSSPAVRWIVTISFAVAEAACFVAWQAFDVANAGRVLQFWLWTFVTLVILASRKSPTEKEARDPVRTPGRRAFVCIRWLSMITMLVWIDHIALAIAMTVALLFSEAWIMQLRTLREKLKHETGNAA